MDKGIIKDDKLINTITCFIAMTVLFSTVLSVLTSDILGVEIKYIVFPIILITFLFIHNLNKLTRVKYFLSYFFIFIIKYIFLLYQAVTKSLPMGGNDWMNYDYYAREILLSTSSLLEILTYSSRDLFSRMVALIYYFSNSEIVVVYLYIFSISLMLFGVIIKFSYLLFEDDKISQLSAILYTIWPIEFIFSLTFLREIPIQYLFILSLYYFVLYLTKGNYVDLALAFFFAVLGALMHSGMIVIVFVYAFMIFNDVNKKNISLISPKIFISFFLLLIILMLSPLWDSLMLKFQALDSIDDIVEQTQVAAGNTTYIRGSDSLIGTVLQVPYRFVMFAVSPLPWQVYNVSTLISFLLTSIPQWYLLIQLYFYFFKVKVGSIFQRNLKKMFFLIILFVYLIFSLGTQNFGTAIRHRMKIFPLEIVLITSVGHLRRKNIEDEK